MKAIVKVFVVLFLLIAGVNLGGNTLTAAPDDIVNIPDENFKACINKIIGQDLSADITEKQMASILSLQCESGSEGSETNIKSLEGVQYSTSLKYLNVQVHEITDLSPISDLPEITSIDVSGNNISDISALSKLTTLTSLYLDSNSIEDIEPLRGLVNLEYLNLYGNNVNDASKFSMFSEFKNLEQLHLAINGISDVSTLSVLKDLPKLYYVRLIQNSITDISAFNDFPSSITLVISNQKIVLDDIVVYDSSYQLPDATTIFTDKDGGTVSYGKDNSYTLQPGVQNITNTWFGSGFNGNITQNVDYRTSVFDIKATDFSVEVGTALSDEDITSLALAEAIDDYSTVITDDIIVNDRGSLDTNTVGVYPVTLSVINGRGEEKTVVINVTVLEGDTTNNDKEGGGDNGENAKDEEESLPKTGLTTNFLLVILVGALSAVRLFYRE